jgi:hypothetical protein
VEELRPWVGQPPITTPPDIAGYQLVRGEQLNIMRASLLGLLLAPLWWVLYVLIVGFTGGETLTGLTISIPNLIGGIALALPLIVVHELLHGVAVLLSGNRPSFGIGPGFAYTTCHAPLSRNGYILVVALPLCVINLAAICAGAVWPGALGWMLFVSLINTMGAGGDIWMLVRLRAVPRTARVVDLASGFAIYLPAQATTASAIEP